MLGAFSPLLSIGVHVIQVPINREKSLKGYLHHQVYLAHLTEGQGGAEAQAAAVGTSLPVFSGA